MKIFLQYFITVILVAITFPLFSQLVSVRTSNETVYTAIRNGKNIGWLKTTIFQSGNETYLTTESKLVVDLLISFTAIAKTFNKYAGSVLTEATVYRTLNGRTKLDNKIRYAGGQYHLSSNEEVSPITKAIRQSVTFLYFNEPKGISEVFSEVYLNFLQVIKTAENTYTTPLPDGGNMTYTYRMGRLINVIAKSSYGTVQFRLVQ